MNELYFRVEKSDFQSESPSALYFDELFEYLDEELKGELRETFCKDVIVPLDKLFREKYETIAKPESTLTETDFSFNIPIEILKQAIPSLEWYLNTLHDGGKYAQTAKDLINATRDAIGKNSYVFIWGE